jgi:hypothetical protein
MLPIMEEVKEEAKRRRIRLLVVPTAEAIKARRRARSKATRFYT